MSATSLDLSQIKTDALSAASTFRTLIGLGSGNTPTFLGATLTGGTVTASAPLINATQTWNNAGTVFTGILANVTDTASSSSSLLMDLQVGGSSRFSVSKSGTVVTTFNTSVTTIGQRWIGTDGTTYWNAGGIFESGNSNIQLDARGGIVGSGQGRVNLGAGYLHLEGGPTTTGIRTFGSLVFAPAALGSTGAIEQRNATNAQTFRIYESFTDASNYTRGKLEWSSNVLRIGTEKAGTGSARALELQTDGTTRLTIDTAGKLSATADQEHRFGQSIIYGDNTWGARWKWSGGGNGVGMASASLLPAVSSGMSLGEWGYTGWNYIYLATGVNAANNGVMLHPSGAAHQLEQRNSTNAQTFRIYESFTDASNYTRGKLEWSSNVFRIGTEKAGTGSARALELQTDGTTRLTIGTTGLFTIADALNIAVGTTTGTKIGTATTQKLGFWNATPVVQPTAVADATDAASVITQLNALLSRMRTLGLIAT